MKSLKYKGIISDQWRVRGNFRKSEIGLEMKILGTFDP
jgi:hypothetical protein